MPFTLDQLRKITRATTTSTTTRRSTQALAVPKRAPPQQARPRWNNNRLARHRVEYEITPAPQKHAGAATTTPPAAAQPRTTDSGGDVGSNSFEADFIDKDGEIIHVGKIVSMLRDGRVTSWSPDKSLVGVVSELIDVNEYANTVRVRVVVSGIAPYAPASRDPFVPGGRVVAEIDRKIPVLLGSNEKSGRDPLVGIALTPHSFLLCPWMMMTT
jgi:hypothetical protein